jgi:poly-beta-1,6-N-acetyl-D-glucosamine biosynthesis protein PgaD
MNTRDPRPAWPPLVGVERVPLFIRVRDTVLTLLAWATLVYLLRDSIALAWDYLRAPMFELTHLPPPDWRGLAKQLEPYGRFVAGLIAWLVFWGFVRRKRIRAVPPSEQPPELPVEAQATALDLDPADVERWREWRIAVVEFDDAGRPRSARDGANPVRPGTM